MSSSGAAYVDTFRSASGERRETGKRGEEKRLAKKMLNLSHATSNFFPIDLEGNCKEPKFMRLILEPSIMSQCGMECSSSSLLLASGCERRSCFGDDLASGEKSRLSEGKWEERKKRTATEPMGVVCEVFSSRCHNSDAKLSPDSFMTVQHKHRHSHTTYILSLLPYTYASSLSFRKKTFPPPSLSLSVTHSAALLFFFFFFLIQECC